MPFTDLTPAPTAPHRSMTPEAFIDAADAFVAWQAAFEGEIGTFQSELEAAAAIIAAADAYADTALKVIADSNLTPAANKMLLYTSASVAALTTATAAGLSLLGAADAAAQRTALSVSQTSDTLLKADNLSGLASATTARTNLGLGSAAILAETTAAEFRNNTADKVLSTDQVWSAAATVALTPGTNVAVDLSSGINFTLAMGGNYTLSNPTNAKVGQTGFILITQDATGSRTLAYGADWKFAGGTDPTLSTTANTDDVLFYQVLASGKIFASLIKAIA